MSPYARIERRRLEERLARLRPQVQAAMENLAALGVRARVIGSFASGTFRAHSDVDFLIEDPRDASIGQIYEAIASQVREAPFDVVYRDWLSESGRAIMEITE
jgi:predicted nucleotidyltransferase